MKKTTVLLILAAQVCCHQPQKSVEAPEPAPLDSFTVSGISIGQQVQHFQYLDDSTLSSYDKIGSVQVLFRLRAKKTYEAAAHKPIQTEAWSSYFRNEAGNNYFIDENNLITAYDPSYEHVMWAKPITHQFRHLADEFSIYHINNAPVIMRGDTMIASIAHDSQQSYKRWFKESSFTEFLLREDSILFLGSYIPRPAQLAGYELPFETFCFRRNTLYMIYPPFDTLYSYNRSTHTQQKMPIGNNDYRLPEAFDHSKLWGPEAGSYQTRYHLHQFQYAAIYFNEASRHFVLFYYAPLDKPANGKLANPKDQKLKALVLDEKLNQIAYYTFHKPFVTPISYFCIPGKGLAMPVYKGENSYETTQFYIYNL